jgi:secondary thiamine-phosphate synthase enzyme
MTYQGRFEVQTSGHRDMQDITPHIARNVADAGIETGTAHVFVVGSTAAVGTIEFEPGLASDLPTVLDLVVPPSRDYDHERAWHDGNGHSHLQATWLGPSLTVPVESGQLSLGTWQQVFLLECDVRPRKRTLVVTVCGD